MRHRIHGRHLGRDPEHRRAMLRNLAAGLFEHGEVETTLPKAKAVQPMVEKLITLAKKNTFAARRRIESKLNDRKIHAWVADPNVPDSAKDSDHFDLPEAGDIEFNRYGEVRKAPRLVQHIMTKVAPKFADRDGGYTRIIRTGRHRLGDGADIVLLQLVGSEDGPEIGGGGRSGRREQANKRGAFAAKLRKEGEGTSAKATTTAEEAPPPSGDELAEEPEALHAEADAPQDDANESTDDSREKSS